jgi:hypothetical protein
MSMANPVAVLKSLILSSKNVPNNLNQFSAKNVF